MKSGGQVIPPPFRAFPRVPKVTILRGHFSITKPTGPLSLLLYSTRNHHCRVQGSWDIYCRVFRCTSQGSVGEKGGSVTKGERAAKSGRIAWPGLRQIT